jgi:hypothetical protein
MQADSEQISAPHELVIQARPKKGAGAGIQPLQRVVGRRMTAKAQPQGFPAFLISLVDDATHAGQVWVLDRVM